MEIRWVNMVLRIPSECLEGICVQDDSCVACLIMWRRVLSSNNLRAMAVTSWSHEAVGRTTTGLGWSFDKGVRFDMMMRWLQSLLSVIRDISL